MSVAQTTLTDQQPARRMPPSARDVTAALALRHSSPEWAFFSEVPEATGFASRRRCDGLAMNLWPSRGLEIHGFEVKVDRRDWLRELKNPAKAEEGMFNYCDRWWLVVGDKSVAREEELPVPWGLYVLGEKGLRVAKQAALLQPVPLNRSVIASILRHATESTVPKSTLHEQVEAATAARGEEWRKSLDRCAEELRELREKVRRFEQTAGFSLESWDRGNVAAGLAALSAPEKALGRVAYAERILKEALREIRNAQQALDPEREATP